jgi:hypothetical protein
MHGYHGFYQHSTSRAGTGNGTLTPVSVERKFYSKIKTALGFPDFFSDIIEQVLTSIHGAIASFMEYKNEQRFLRTHHFATLCQILNLDVKLKQWLFSPRQSLL